MRQRQLGAGEGQLARVAARTNNNFLALQTRAVPQLQRVGIDKFCRAPLGNRLHVGCLQQLQQPLLLVYLLDNLLHPPPQLAKIKRRHFALDAVIAKLVGVAQEAGGFSQRARGHAAVVGAGAAQAVALNHGYLCAQLAGPQRCRCPSRATADDQYFVHKIPVSGKQ